MKTLLFRIYDLLLSPLTFIAAIHMRTLRRYGLPNFPIAHKILFKVGILPISRHFYEPLFHPDDLKRPLKNLRHLPGIEFDLKSQLALLKRFRYNDEILRYFDGASAGLPGCKFVLANPGFREGDVELYYNVVRNFKPSRIIEIGSGYSTMVALQAAHENETENPAHRCAVAAIEPYPWFKHEKLNLMPKFVEDVEVGVFTQLRQNDILFIDSSHMIRPQGDVLYEILELLPALAPGVLVHVHDVFTPSDYLEDWLKVHSRFWNEQYLVEAFLSCNDQFKVLLSPNYLQVHHPRELLDCCPLLARNPASPIHSFWFQRISSGIASA
ncbi:MAG: class I SAM-dependent methyltransferase [Methylacidiphilales bacterium]|nr:class I SAM-dependent methyltransferase [Candidatus Methylacidiphilales bacterium]